MHLLLVLLSLLELKAGMPAYKVARKTSIRSFVKLMNVSHLIPTRYSVEKDIDVKSLLPSTIDMNDVSQKREACKAIAAQLMDKFQATNPSIHMTFFRKKLNF